MNDDGLGLLGGPPDEQPDEQPDAGGQRYFEDPDRAATLARERVIKIAQAVGIDW